jgi:hypothetical protein
MCSVHGDVVRYASFIKISILAKVKKDPKNKISQKATVICCLVSKGVFDL